MYTKSTPLLIVFLMWLSSYSFAQSERTATHLNIPFEQNITLKANNSRAQGDTLFLFDGQQVFIRNTQDQMDFEFEVFDGDSVRPDPAMVADGWDSTFMFLYSLDPFYFLPGEITDTAFFMGSTSWLETPGKVDNWFSFGPITIPTTGATLNWFHLIPSVDFSDGYRIFVSTTGVTPYQDIDTATAIPIYTRPDCAPGACPSDTLWTNQSASLANYAGNRIWIHYNHNAFDKYVLYLDMIKITEGETVSLPLIEKNISNFNNHPNPVKNQTTITYSLESSSQVELIIYNIAGKEIMNVKQGFKTKGNHNINLSMDKVNSGVYFYSLVTENKRETKKMVVVK
ncbi:MAG: T9SS type A sorting domain-containing protein [Bacteroidetes bacterium]|nr:T9SS type A sorting domain-containing protein [Bacteroidota bacterium]HET6244283.1 T9SS type A sorting domain-containing protein [Bacteroidia bacterium]